MSGGEVKVSFGELASAAGSISSSAQQVQQQLEDLKQQVVKVMGSYEGAAAAAYQQKQNQWDTSAADLQSVLSAIGIAVRDAGEAYQAAENANTNRW
ncbi:WXG100 family type VII secretion target [Lentzea sp. NEAU-D13]|uniref:ESAT-6-like protein n=1 Tax=Lentzea alba TaxID=2714351 RepID=A0A7C9RMT5_9PSEU|nr:WXG100 family type VII secretion target [Lentzea alba]NGY58629.1 WXG100 family type VII secretion target [Lentzea alba]